MSEPEPFKPIRFGLGNISVTDGAYDAIGAFKCGQLVGRHAMNDWGDLDEHDRLLNDSAVLNCEDTRIFSAYTVDGHRIYVITEHDRTLTTVLLSDEY